MIKLKFFRLAPFLPQRFLRGEKVADRTQHPHPPCGHLLPFAKNALGEGKYFLISLLAHTLFLLFTFQLIPFQTTLGTNEVIRAYALPQPSSPSLSLSSPRSLSSLRRRGSTHNSLDNNRPLNPNRDDNAKKHKDLLSLLHRAISEQQIYPESALALHQTGIVKIEFLLEPNGTVKKINISKSSGNEILDAAALEATKAISPVKGIDSYLKNADVFSVDVVFGDLG